MKYQKMNERIRKAFKDADLSYRAVQRRVSLSRTTVQRYIEGDVSTMPINKFLLLCKVLNVSPHYILGSDKELDTVFWETYR